MAPVNPLKPMIPSRGTPVARPPVDQGQESRKGAEPARDTGFERLDFRTVAKSATKPPATENSSGNSQAAAAENSEPQGFTLQTLSAIAGMFTEALQPQETIRPGAPVNRDQSPGSAEVDATNSNTMTEQSDGPSRPLRP
ncbi:MAG: hypothetical protein ACR2OW_03245 [Methyloligellaceae bacterium]